MPTYTSFKNVCNISKKLISEKIEENMIALIDWAMIDRGGIINVNVDDSGCYVDDRSKLYLVDDPRHSEQIWQGPQNWVYTSGMENGDGNYPATVYTNGIVTVPDYINYRDGQVIFDTPLPTGTLVQASYSYKWANVYSAREVPFIRRIEYNHLRYDDNRNPVFHYPAETRIELPCIAVEVPPISSSRNYAMGGQREYTHSIHFHIIANSDWESKRLADAIAFQEDKVFMMFDSEEAFASGDYPLNHNGTVNTGISFPDLVEGYTLGSIYFKKVISQNGSYISQNLYMSKVSVDAKILSCNGC